MSSDSLATTDHLQRRQLGALRLGLLLTAAIGGLALIGRQGDPATRKILAGEALPIAAVVALTGNANLYGQDQRDGLLLAEQWFNKSSAQRLLRLQIEDGGSDEASAIAAFNLLIRKGVLALIGPTLSQQAFAADPIAQRSGVPVVAASNTAMGIPEIGSFITRVSAPSSKVAPLSIKEALQRNPHLKRVAVFYAQDDAYSTAETSIFQKSLQAAGLPPVSVQRTQLADNDFQNPISAALRQKPELVVISAQAVDGGNLVRQLRELGYRGQIVVGNGLNTPNIYPICQRWCHGILIAQAYSPELDSAVNKALVRLYRQGHGGKFPPQITAQAFTAYQVLFESIQRLQTSGGFQQQNLEQARQRLKLELLRGTYSTPLGSLSFNKDGDVVQQHFFVAEVQMNPEGSSGRFALVRQRSLGSE